MLSQVIDLYRAINRPPLEEGKFSYKGACDSNLLCLIDACRVLPENYGRFTYNRTPPGQADIEFIVPSGECGFYSNFESFVEMTPTLGHGLIPDEFYIIDEDWAPSDAVEHASFKKIESCANLINYLKGIAAAFDDKSNGAFVNLLFAVPTTSVQAQKIVSVSTVVGPAVLNASLSKLNLIKYLASSKVREELHFDEKKSILAVALAEVACECVGSESDRFGYLLKNWSRVLDIYWRNFQTYLHGFSFEVVRQQIAKAELEYGSKLSGVFSDIAGKILALPLSLGALLLLNKATTLLETWVTSVGIVMVTLIFLGVLWNQWLNVSRLYSSFTQAFAELNAKADDYPRKIRAVITNARNEVSRQHTFVAATLVSFAVFALLPTFGMAYLVYFNWGSNIVKFWAGS